jgi:hypothetical protein
MAQFGKTDAATDSPFYTPAQLKKKANTANRDALYANTTHRDGVFAVDNLEQAATASPAAHTGWIFRRKGTGKLGSITITAGGTGYSNLDVLKIAAPADGTNATASVVTDANGTITSVTITTAGAGFTAKHPTVAIANTTGGTANGTGATFTSTALGKAGRVTQEVLAAIGITTDGSDDTVYPDA